MRFILLAEGGGERGEGVWRLVGCGAFFWFKPVYSSMLSVSLLAVCISEPRSAAGD